MQVRDSGMTIVQMGYIDIVIGELLVGVKDCRYDFKYHIINQSKKEGCGQPIINYYHDIFTSMYLHTLDSELDIDMQMYLLKR